MEEYELIFGKYLFNAKGVITYNPDDNEFTFKFTLPREQWEAFKKKEDEYFTVGEGWVKFRLVSIFSDLLGNEYVAMGSYSFENYNKFQEERYL